AGFSRVEGRRTDSPLDAVLAVKGGMSRYGGPRLLMASTPREEVNQCHKGRTRQSSQQRRDNQPELTSRLLQVSFQVLQLIADVVQPFLEGGDKKFEFTESLLMLINPLAVGLARHLTSRPLRYPRLVRKAAGPT